jgi:hypothetical protein
MLTFILILLSCIELWLIIQTYMYGECLAWYFPYQSYVFVTCEIRISRIRHMISIYAVLKRWTMVESFFVQKPRWVAAISTLAWFLFPELLSYLKVTIICRYFFVRFLAWNAFCEYWFLRFVLGNGNSIVHVHVHVANISGGFKIKLHWWKTLPLYYRGHSVYPHWRCPILL